MAILQLLSSRSNNEDIGIWNSNALQYMLIYIPYVHYVFPFTEFRYLQCWLFVIGMCQAASCRQVTAWYCHCYAEAPQNHTFHAIHFVTCTFLSDSILFQVFSEAQLPVP